MTWTLWWNGALLGAAVWLGLRLVSRLSAAERFQVWLLYLLTLPLLGLLPLRPAHSFVLESGAAQGIARAAGRLPLAIPYYWLIAGAITVWCLSARIAALRIWRRASGDKELRYSDEIAGPAAYGLFRSRILLPLDAASWTGDRLARVLAHERAHGERRDILWDLVGSVIVALCWLQPFAWLALREMRRLREWACDDCVLAEGSDRIEYAQTLYELASETSLQPAMAGLGRGSLEKRMKHLLNDRVPRRRATVLSASLAMLTLVALACFTPKLSIAQDQERAEKKWDKAPRVLHKVEPQYTEDARERKVRGTAIYRILIGIDGKASDVQVLRSLDPDLDAQGILALERWEFQPAEKDGHPIAVDATVEINFRLF
ncbi:M56 family metallopeptidase [Bryobacter aggregatus]|uniref:M56 family metallopeptidase n=1 Tax=Bryobacter aggregatus TaxID=360054 RepID=UPI0004E1D265|nr:M56 family metallopeptidase [Bryobacter aggregatus]